MIAFAKVIAMNALRQHRCVIKTRREKRRLKGQFIANSGRSFHGLTEDGRLDWQKAA